MTDPSESLPASDVDAGANLDAGADLDTSAEPAVPAPEPTGEPPKLPPRPDPPASPGQTLAGRMWIGLIVAAVLLILLIIFIAENTKSISINFLGAHGHIPEFLALLIAVVLGTVITLLVGSARIVQLRLEFRRQRQHLRHRG